MKQKPSNPFGPSLHRLALILSAALLAGCAGTGALRSSFNDYSGVYAETQNNQMLLNLARLHEGYPIYFFQLGQISASYTFTETAGLTGTTSKTVSAMNPPSVLSGTANLGETITHNPIFTLVPLAGNMFAAQLLLPISPTVFEQNFEQGWRVDQLMRILVERIEITGNIIGSDGKSKTPFKYVFENNPWDGEGDENYKFDPNLGEPTGYDHFLRACALARACQKAGVLHLVRDVEPLPLQSLKAPPEETRGSPSDTKEPAVTVTTAPGPGPGNSTIVIQLNDSSAAAKGSSAGSGGSDVSPAAKDSLLTDVTNADKAGLTYQKINGTWQIVKNVERTSFQFDQVDDTTSKMNSLLAKIEANPVFNGTPSNMALFKAIIKSGFSISDKSSSGPEYQGSVSVASENGIPGEIQVTQVRFVMRSLMGVITDLATEQQAFDARNKDPKKGVVDPLTIKEVDPHAIIPDEENRPLLTLTWPGNITPGPAVASLDFANQHFTIADEPTTDPQQPKTWNRDVFRMLVQLSFEVTTDASNLTTTPVVSVRGN